VPKGIPYTKGEKRLAVHVEDHPVSYIDFEGTIPKGQYGGGTVMVWDQGTFETPSRAPAKELESGKLHFTLHGKKLSGEWYLVRLLDDKQWLLIRGTNNMRPVSKKMDDTSALSGKTISSSPPEVPCGNRIAFLPQNLLSRQINFWLKRLLLKENAGLPQKLRVH